MKIFISGKINGCKNYRDIFSIAKKVLGIPIFFSVESLKEELLKNTD